MGLHGCADGPGKGRLRSRLKPDSWHKPSSTFLCPCPPHHDTMGEEHVGTSTRVPGAPRLYPEEHTVQTSTASLIASSVPSSICILQVGLIRLASYMKVVYPAPQGRLNQSTAILGIYFSRIWEETDFRAPSHSPRNEPQEGHSWTRSLGTHTRVQFCTMNMTRKS